MRKLDKRVVNYIILIIFGVLLIFNYQRIWNWMGNLWSVLFPVILGFIIAYVLNLVMEKFEKILFPDSEKKILNAIRRPLSILLSIVVIVFIFSFVIGLVVPQIINVLSEFVEALPIVFDRVENWVGRFEELLPSETGQLLDYLEQDWDNLLDGVQNIGGSMLTNILNRTVSTVGSMVISLINVFLAFVFSLYILMSKEHLLDQFLRLVTTYFSKPTARKILYVMTTMNDSLRDFLTGEVISATILGTLTAVGMWIFGFPYALMVGSITGVLSLIPYLGAYLAGAVGVILISVQSVSLAFWFVIFMVVIQQLEGNLIYPRVVGDSLGLPGLWVLAAVTVGGGFAGIPGMLLGVPIASGLYKLLSRDVRDREVYSHGERHKLKEDARHDSFKRIDDEYRTDNDELHKPT